MTLFKYTGLRASQAVAHDVFVYAADPHDVLKYSEVDRVGRSDDGQLKGFQRHQISSHIKEIRDYLARHDALLPNAVILAFVDGVSLTDVGGGVVNVEIDATKGKPGFVVDGQQRLTALAGLEKPGFQVFVSCLVCKDYNELRQQFVLINNTRPLPKTLIYELLPTVDGLPERFTTRKFAARIVDRLNYCPDSSLRGEIRQHTNPNGMLSDTAMQKIVMNSASDGAIRAFIQEEDRENLAYNFVNEYFAAVKAVFGPEWHGMAPRVSRLRHGAGLISMGFVMDLLYSNEGATLQPEFEWGLELLKPYTAWTSGQWKLAEFDERPWNGVQNTPTDIDLLTRYLVRSLKKAIRNSKRAVNE